MGTEILGEPPQRYLTAGRRWSFCNAVLDEQSLELIVEGKPARIEHKPLEILLYFLNHVGKVVTKDELQNALWPGRIVTDNVLTTHISLIRRALGEAGHEAIATVRGFGYRFVAEVSVLTVDTAPEQTDFGSGSPVPWKPHWTFSEKLGAGGTSDVWLARHDKTHESVVIKIARTGAALSSLRREVTLWRVIKESLGNSAPVARILDWGLEREPYYLEVEYIAGQDLETWVRSRGGFENVPLEVRLEIVAQVADALASAHAVGVLHKDLKPSNVLIAQGATETMPLAPKVKLCDFGSGVLLDAAILDQLKITRADLTQTGTGTALYMAPELIDRQPATARSDLYSLGVILFQMVVGNFQKSLAPGWERDISDGLLVADIHETAAGDPAARLAEAGELAERLRALPARRVARQAALAEAARVERTQRIAAELKRARSYVTGLGVLALCAICGASLAYQQWRETVKANASSAALYGFLADDVLRIDPSAELPSKASYQSLLEKAAAKVDERFQDQPSSAATLHLLLGRRFQESGELEAALFQYKRAADLETLAHGVESDQALLAIERYANSLFGADKAADSLATFMALIARCERMHSARDLACLTLRGRVARLRAVAGEYEAAETELRTLLTQIPEALDPTEETTVLLREWLGVVLVSDVSDISGKSGLAQLLKAQIEGTLGTFLVEYAGDYREGERVLKDSIRLYRSLGRRGELEAENSLSLSEALAAEQNFAEADATLQAATKFFDESFPAHHWLHSAPLNVRAANRMNDARWTDAVEAETAALDLCTSVQCNAIYRDEFRYELALALMGAGRNDEAVPVIRESLHSYGAIFGSATVGALKRRVSLVEGLIALGRNQDAQKELALIKVAQINALPRTDHLVRGEYLRLQGLLAAKSGDVLTASKHLSEAQQIIEKRLGPNHWKTRRVTDELRNLTRS